MCTDPFTYVGVAPDAELIVVVLHHLYSSPRRIEHGLDFIWRHPKVRGRPVVVNISLAEHLGSLDGTSMLERAITADVQAQPGRAVVVAAGNEQDKERHARVELNPGDRA